MTGKTMLLAGITIGLFAATGLVASHPLPYAQAQPGKPNPSTGLGVSIMDCGTGNHLILNLSVGGVCFGSEPEFGWDENCGYEYCIPELPGQHLPDEPTVTLEIHDAAFPLIPASYCQNLNFPVDNLCGGNLTGAPEPGNADPLCQVSHLEGVGNCTLRSEPYVEFCGTITIRRGLDGPTAPDARLPGGSDTGVPLPYAGTWADAVAAPANWDIEASVRLFLSAPLNGNPASPNACTPIEGYTAGWATQGWVSHT